MPLDFEDITWAAGTDNTAGIQQNIYFINADDVETFPALPKIETGTTLASLAIVAANVVLKATTNAQKVYCTLEAGAANSESQGEMDGMSFKNTLKFFVPGNTPTADGFARAAKNGSFYIVYADQDGNKYLLGHPGYPAKMMSAPGGTGEKAGDRKGRTYTFQSVWSGPAPHFTGKVMVQAVEQVLVFLA